MNRIEAFGQVICDERHRLGYSQEALAEKSGLHRNFISLVERGQTSAALDSIFSLAAALDLSVSELFARVERM